MKESDKIEQTKDSGMDLRDYFAARAMPFIEKE